MLINREVSSLSVEEFMFNDLLQVNSLFNLSTQHTLKQISQFFAEETHLIQILKIFFALDQHNLLFNAVPESSVILLTKHTIYIISGQSLLQERVDLIGDGEHRKPERVHVGLL